MGFKLVKKPAKKAAASIEEVNASLILALKEDHSYRSTLVVIFNTTSVEQKNDEEISCDDKFFEDIFLNKEKEAAKSLVLEDLSSIIVPVEVNLVVDRNVEEGLVIDKRKIRR
jgi:hypothetical protein